MFHKGIILTVRMVQKIGKDRVRAHSAEAAFFLIMSVFPILMLILTMLRYTPLSAEVLIVLLEELTPFEISGDVQGMVDSIYGNSAAVVPWTILIAIWTAGKGILGLSDGLNAINSIYETKNYFVTRARCAFYTIILILALMVSIVILVFGNGMKDFLMQEFPLLAEYRDEMTVLPIGIALILLVLLFSILYACLPNRRLSYLRQIPGAAFTSISWAVFSFFFSVYLRYFLSNMSILYGSLTTLVVVMLWLYFCMYLFFIGAEINLYLENPVTFGS